MFDGILRNIFGAPNALQFSTAEAISLASTDYTTEPFFALYVGTSGAVKVDMHKGATGVTFAGMPAGLTPLLVTKVYKVGTDATNLIALR